MEASDKRMKRRRQAKKRIEAIHNVDRPISKPAKRVTKKKVTKKSKPKLSKKKIIKKKSPIKAISKPPKSPAKRSLVPSISKPVPTKSIGKAVKLKSN